ncbi:hypothetical protein M3Y96_01109800 [Aphelenchoides besseyi]|nr:hypothetical protein M3Y96_01109800 [Aphelenchoides besseyi]
MELTPQLKYICGYAENQFLVHGSKALYDCDLSGVYSPGLTDNIVLGDKMTSLLRIINISSTPGMSVETVCHPMIFLPVIPKEVSSIEISLRSLQGELMPLNYGHSCNKLWSKSYLILQQSSFQISFKILKSAVEIFTKVNYRFSEVLGLFGISTVLELEVYCLVCGVHFYRFFEVLEVLLAKKRFQQAVEFWKICQKKES